MALYGRRPRAVPDGVAVYNGDNLVSVKEYQVEKKLGQGGFGTTYLAVKNGRRYVVKAMDPKYAIDEYQALATLGMNCVKHINCPVELIRGTDVSYLITEYIPGKDLDFYLRQNLSPKFIRDMMLQTIKAILFIHSENIAHRDIKPANIMYVEPSNDFYLIDFGIACFPQGNIIKCPSSCPGTPLFMHPLYEAKCHLNKGTKEYFNMLKTNDKFALGVTFYLMIEKRYPWAIIERSRDVHYDFNRPNGFRRATPIQQEIIEGLVSGNRSLQDIYSLVLNIK